MEEHGMSRSESRLRAAGLALAGFLILSAGPLWAGPQREPSRAELEERIRRLEQIITEHGLDKPPAAKPAPAPAPLEPSQVESIVEDKLKKQKVLAGWKDGFYLESPDGSYKLKFRGYLQADARFPFGTEPNSTGEGVNATNSSFYLRRVRPIFEGTVAKYFDFRIMPDFGLGQTTLQDGYLDVNYFGPEERLRAGKTKVPFSLERLQSAADLLFIERAISQNLAPNRDIGFYLFGDLLDSVVTYQVGAFDGIFDSGSITEGDVNTGKEMAARVFAHPFKKTDWSWATGLGIGVAGTYGNDDDGDNESALNWRSAERVSVFKFKTSSTLLLNATGNRARVSPQGYYYWGPFGLMGEYINTHTDLLQEDTANDTTKTGSFDPDGWFVQASYVLTGEDASYKGVMPINAFDPRNGRWGAFEVALRGSKLHSGDEVFADGFADHALYASNVSEITAGLNWYLNRNFKFQLNYVNTSFDRSVEINDALFDDIQSILFQLQISY
jgi:phosphate-selective porin OprO and OprP